MSYTHRDARARELVTRRLGDLDATDLRLRRAVKLETLEKQQRAARVAQVEMGPEVAAQRELWLSTYGANKQLVRGLLAHFGKPELLPLIFDDLAETHRVSGVSDAVAPTDGAAAPDGAAADTP